MQPQLLYQYSFVRLLAGTALDHWLETQRVLNPNNNKLRNIIDKTELGGHEYNWFICKIDC